MNALPSTVTPAADAPSSSVLPTLPVAFDFELPEGVHLPAGVGTILAVSHDHANIVYVGDSESGRQLYLRNINEIHGGRPLEGTENALYPEFSEDGE